MDPFTPMEDDPPPIPTHDIHPVPRKNIHQRNNNDELIPEAPTSPLHTNVFYANLFLGDQCNSVWTQPYSLQWAKGGGNARSWGMAISHVEREMMAFGPVQESNGASQYFINPIGIHSIVLSAGELGEGTTLSTDSHCCFSGNVNLSPSEGVQPLLSIPMLQGMAFVTGIYRSCTPLIQSSVFIRDLSASETLGPLAKYRVTLEDGKTWLLYVSSQEGESPGFRLANNTTITGQGGFTGLIQVAKLPQGADESIYDRSAGSYPTECTVSAVCDGSEGTYRFMWTKGGLQDRPLLMFALPHHLASFTHETAGHVTPIQLQATTKGVAAAVLADQWIMREKLPTDMGFNPWHRDRGSIDRLSTRATQAVNDAAMREVEQDFMSQCCLDSMYFSGKGLAKFAMMLIPIRQFTGNSAVLEKGLQKLKAAMAVFVENRQVNPLKYDTSWRGVVSVAGLNGDAGADFGNSWFNDHHFHYGYFVYTGAVLAALDPSWLEQGNNKRYVNMLIKDYANSTNSIYFPFSRSFDWYSGHSWAKGLFDSADGKDEESTSEDAFASYALKMWGASSQQPALEARGNLMLAIQARTFPTYFLMTSDNTIQPPQFIGNKVTGILFENKADHATYFGMNPEYIQGIHMIPLSPCSSLIRSPQFVGEEFGTYFSDGRVDQVAGGWRGILYANLALCDPGAAGAAYRFFAQESFDLAWLDGGASRTWYLAYTAALGGA